MNKKGFSPFIVLGVCVVLLLAFYLFLFLPIPALKSVRQQVEYFIILGLWIVIQAGFIYFYFKIALWSMTLFKFYKEYVFGLSLKIKNFIQVHV